MDVKESNFWIPVYNGLLRSDSLTGNELKIYLYYLSHGSVCFKTHSLISTELGLGIRTIQRCNKSLEDKKYIYVQRLYKDNSKEKDTLKVFPIPLSKYTGKLTENAIDMLEYFLEKYPSDY